MVRAIGPVIASVDRSYAVTGSAPSIRKYLYKASTRPCTAPSRIARSPAMSDRYSDRKVVANVYGDPSPIDHASARSHACPSGSACTAMLALIPAPLTVAPCWYRRRTESPIPFGHTAITGCPSGNALPIEVR